MIAQMGANVIQVDIAKNIVQPVCRERILTIFLKGNHGYKKEGF